jgi:ComF family protein
MAKSLAVATGAAGDVFITYVPTANARVRERGYDQAALIARELSRQVGSPCVPLLARVGGQRQLGQGRAARKKQMEGAFRVLKPALLQNKHVLLVDDVLTTGATCEAAARVLRQAGAKRVSAAVFAVA